MILLRKLRWLARAKLSLAPVVVLIWEKKAEVVRGGVPPSLLSEFSQVAKENEIPMAIITVTKRGGTNTLSFTGSIPDHVQQRFRNVWFAYPERKMLRV